MFPSEATEGEASVLRVAEVRERGKIFCQSKRFPPVVAADEVKDASKILGECESNPSTVVAMRRSLLFTPAQRTGMKIQVHMVKKDETKKAKSLASQTKCVGS